MTKTSVYSVLKELTNGKNNNDKNSKMKWRKQHNSDKRAEKNKANCE